MIFITNQIWNSLKTQPLLPDETKMKKIRKSSKKKSKRSEKIDEKSRRFSDTIDQQNSGSQASSGIKDSVSRRQASFGIFLIISDWTLALACSLCTKFGVSLWSVGQNMYLFITFVPLTGTWGLSKKFFI